MIEIPKFEQGGFPTPGNLFMCYGDGEPEMIGSLNGMKYHGNSEQIIEAVSLAFQKAFDEKIKENPNFKID